MLAGVGLFTFKRTSDQAPDYAGQRARLVEHLRNSSRVRDPRILDAFARVPRHLFVPEARRTLAYEDRALPLVEQQTISQPSMIAIMLEALDCQPDDQALEVGAGCGYAAALLGQLVAVVNAIEIRPNLAELARATLALIGTSNVQIHVGDGRAGLPSAAPFHRILVSAGAGSIPPALVEQLAFGGRIAIPVNDGFGQTLYVGERTQSGKVKWVKSVPCLFVPLVG